MSRTGVDRVLKFAFELARTTPKKHLTSATKSNGIAITMPYWDERVKEMAKAYPDVKWNQFHIDILTAHFVMNPDQFNVVGRARICSATSCRISARPAPGRSASRRRATSIPSGCSRRCSNRVHGSAPDIFGQGIANPIGQIWSGAMMLEHLGEPEAAKAVVTAIEKVLAEPKLRDARILQGAADTVTCGKAVADALA